MVNGRYHDFVELTDRGFQYGDGVFTTARVRSGRPVLLRRHLDRLSRDSRRLQIDIPDPAVIAREALEICSDCNHGVLKLQVTRGPGERGYRLPEEPKPTRALTVHPLPPDASRHRETGVRVRFCRHRLGWNMALAGVKHMNRLEQVLARSEWDDDAVAEGLMLDQAGHVVEGTMSNLFLVRQERLVTPLLDCCGVEGLMRGLILEIASKAGIPAESRRVPVAELADADEMFLTNSLIGVWPVIQLGDIPFAVGSLTRHLASLAEEIMAQETSD